MKGESKHEILLDHIKGEESGGIFKILSGNCWPESGKKIFGRTRNGDRISGDGETKVELIGNGTNQEVNMGEDISLGFEVGSVDEMFNVVKEKGIEIHSGPFQPNPHVKFFFVRDPNGLKIQFVENM